RAELRGRKGLKQWVKGWRNWRPRRRRAARLYQMRSRKIAFFWQRIVPIYLTAQNSRPMGVAALCEIIAGDTRRKPINLNLGIECRKQRIEPFSEGRMRKDTFS